MNNLTEADVLSNQDVLNYLNTITDINDSSDSILSDHDVAVYLNEATNQFMNSELTTVATNLVPQTVFQLSTVATNLVPTTDWSSFNVIVIVISSVLIILLLSIGGALLYKVYKKVIINNFVSF
jgi:hypothetical protein